MEDTKDLTVAEFTEGIGRVLAASDGLDARIKLLFDKDGVILIDATSAPHKVTNEDSDADVTLRMSLETFNQLYRREINPVMAAMTGKIKIEGDLTKAMKLESLLRSFD
jgi:putative sterol carrier protein